MRTVARPEDLVSRIIGADRAALMELYDATVPVVLQLARVCAAGDEQAARRATEAAYVGLWRHALAGDLSGDVTMPTTWLLAAVHRELRSVRP